MRIELGGVAWLTVWALAGCGESATPAASKDAQQVADTEDTASQDAASNDASTDDASTEDANSDAAAADAATDAGGEADASDPCSGQTCGGQGVCSVQDGAAKCTCNPNYVADGLVCIQTKLVPCAATPPANASALPAEVSVTYTDAAGWSAPAACDFACNDGWTRVGGGCIQTSFVQDQCRLACLELQACGQDIGGSVQSCVAGCVTKASNAESFATTACVGLAYEHDGLWCGVIDACGQLASGESCKSRCEAKEKCSFLDAPGITSGSSLEECQVLCRAYDTIYGKLGTTDAYASCLDAAAASCDPFQLALCEAYNGADLCSNVCGWLGTAQYCDYIPGKWADEAACKAACSAWSPQQAHAVFGCYNRLNFADCSTERAISCFDPPATLPAAATTLTAAVASVCPDAMASSDPAVNAWHFLGRTQLWPEWMQDFGGATACIEAFATCPSTYDLDWLATCFVAIAPDVTAACNAALPCLIQKGTQVPYLTIDGQTTIDATRCQVSWQDWKGKEPAKFAKVAQCLGGVDTTDCTAVDACIAGGDPQTDACNELVSCWDTDGKNPYGLADMDVQVCGGLLAFGQNPAVAECVLNAADCAAKNACLPITGLAANAVPACSQLVPCWEGFGVNPFAALGKLTVGTCAAATSIYNANFPGVADMIYGCLQGAADCNAKMACLPK